MDVWEEEADLEPLDPGTGRSLPDRTGSPPRDAVARGVPWQWLVAVTFVVATAAGAYILVNHRSAETLQRSWTAAAAERAQLSVTTETLRRMSTFLDISDNDVADVKRARVAAVKEARYRLRADRRAIVRTVPLDPDTWRLRGRMIGHLDRWITELDDFVAHDRLWVRTAPTQQLDQPVAAMAKRWRTEKVDEVPAPLVAANDVIARLSRPTDVAVPLRFTGFTERGHRIDVDLERGTVSTIALGSQRVGSTAPASVHVVGDQLVATPRNGSQEIALLPVEPSDDVSAAGVAGYLPDTPSPAPWVVSFTGEVWLASPVAGDHPPIALPPGYALQGASRSSIVVASIPEEHAPIDAAVRNELISIATGARSPIDGSLRFLGAWDDTTIWSGPERLLVRQGEAVRSVTLPPGTSASRVARDSDGTLVVVADPVDPAAYATEPRSKVVVVAPGDGIARAVAEARGLVWNVGVKNGWALFVSGSTYTRSQVRVVELATGRELVVRLEDPFLTALAVH